MCDVVQETKLQEKDVEGLLAMDILPGYDSAWTCSTVKKGYAGQAVFFPRQAEEWAGGKRGDKLSTATDGPVRVLSDSSGDFKGKNICQAVTVTGCRSIVASLLPTRLQYLIDGQKDGFTVPGFEPSLWGQRRCCSLQAHPRHESRLQTE